MNRYLVTYYNGRGAREKIFTSRETALAFIQKCEDARATLWREETLDGL